MKLLPGIFFCTILYLIGNPLFSQSGLLGYKTFKVQENNKSHTINALYKNSEGYIYAATTNGLYKFDGIKFTKITPEKPIKDTATTIFEDHQHQLWVGFKSGHISIKKSNQLQYFNPEEGTPQKKITCFAEDKKNNIWFGTQGEGIYYIQNNRLYLIDEENGLPDLNIHSLLVTNNNEVLAATDQGIAVCKVNGSQKQVSIISPKNGLPDYMVTSITKAPNNCYWIGLQDKGYCLYNYPQNRIEVNPVNSSWVYGQINDLLYTGKNLLLATQNNGLIAYDNYSLKKINLPEGNTNNLHSLLQDNQGNIWAAANDELIRLGSGELTLYPVYDKNDFSGIHALLIDKENNFWIGNKQTIIKYQQKNNQFVTKKIRINELTGNTDITSLYQDMYDNIWIGTMGKGLFLLNANNGRYRPLREIENMKSANILSITGRGNTVCIGGLEGAMVFELNSNNQQIESKYNCKNYHTEIGTNYIYYVFKDSKNRIWFATDGKGIAALENGKYTNYNEQTQLKDDHIYSITEDKEGNIWFSTSKAGIYKFNGHKFFNYNSSNGLSDLNISAIKADANGNIIVAHKTGLDILDPGTGQVSYINASINVSDINTDVGAFAQDNTGNIFFCTINGIVGYSPQKEFKRNSTTIIESVQLFLKDIDSPSGSSFDYNEDNITFTFNGLYFSDPESVIYQYKLEGLNNEWITTKDKTITFSQLRPGTYKFIVRSSLNESFINAHEAVYKFTINSPFWKRWWFIVLVILFISGILFWYIKIREANIKRVQQLQQEKIQFQFQVLRNQINPHFLFNSFNTLISVIEENPPLAVEYVEHLSDFFRNIVNYRDKEIISLKEEIDLLQSYFYLQQKRYGNNLILSIEISDQEKEQIFIPPLTLQLLVENAVKHNAISKDKPLHIIISIEGNLYIKILNNINIKFTIQPGAGMGLQNIISRYKLLSHRKVEINKTDDKFIILLPIIK